MNVMKRPLLIVAFVLLLSSIPVLAQHGGGHASGGGHGGFAGHSSFGGHMSSGHAFGGAHAGSGFAGRSSARSFSGSRSFGNHSFRGPLASRGFNRFNHSGIGLRIRTRGYGNCYGNGYGCGYGYGSPWLYGGAFDPYWWWDNDNGSTYDPDQQYETGLANEMNQQSLDEQQMRQQSDPDSYARSAPPPRQHRPERTEALAPTVLVFRDQHKEEVQNYAIVGQTLWNFAPQHTQKIPLSELDIPATQKANDDRGTDFRVPGTGEGQ